MNNNLERLIKQTVPFTSPELKAQLGVLYLSYSYTSKQQAHFKLYNITLQQYNILRILRGQYPKAINISLLRERMLDKMSDTSRLVNRLCKLKLVSKQTNELDKRNADVTITEEALHILKELDKEKFIHDTIFSKLSKEEVNTFNELVDKMLQHL